MSDHEKHLWVQSCPQCNPQGVAAPFTVISLRGIAEQLRQEARRLQEAADRLDKHSANLQKGELES